MNSLAQDLRLARYSDQILGVPEQDFIYAAGFFDGEGSVSIDKTSAKGYAKDCKFPHHYRMRIRIPNTDFQIVEWLQETFGGNTSMYLKGGNRKPQKVWYLSGPRACAFLQQVLPYLKVKSHAARLGIEFEDKRDGSPRISQIEWDRRNSLYLKLKALNYRGQGKNATHS
jgi:LAGLIDADG endonuclease